MNIFIRFKTIWLLFLGIRYWLWFLTHFIMIFIFIIPTILIHLVIFLNIDLSDFKFMLWMILLVECFTLHICDLLFLIYIQRQVHMDMVVRICLFNSGLLLDIAMWTFRMIVLNELFIFLTDMFYFKHIVQMFFLLCFCCKWNTTLFKSSLKLFPLLRSLSATSWL